MARMKGEPQPHSGIVNPTLHVFHLQLYTCSLEGQLMTTTQIQEQIDVVVICCYTLLLSIKDM